MDTPASTPADPDLRDRLDPDELLREEFEYARESALQANVDRGQVVNLYLLLLGGVGSVLLGLPALAREGGLEIPRETFGAALLVLGVLGLFTVLKLVRLRQAWYDAVLAMNRIKDFYLMHYPQLAPAFRWRTETIPAAGKLGTITFDLVLLVSLLDSLAVGVGHALTGLPPGTAAAGAVLFFGGQGTLFFALLRRR